MSKLNCVRCSRLPFLDTGRVHLPITRHSRQPLPRILKTSFTLTSVREGRCKVIVNLFEWDCLCGLHTKSQLKASLLHLKPSQATYVHKRPHKKGTMNIVEKNSASPLGMSKRTTGKIDWHSAFKFVWSQAERKRLAYTANRKTTETCKVSNPCDVPI